VENGYTKIIKMMRTQGAAYNPPELCLAKVVVPPPNLIIKVGDIQITKENILIADYLLKDYKRAYYQEGVLNFSANMNDGTLVGNTVVAANHSHAYNDIKVCTSKDNYYVHGDGKDDNIKKDGSKDELIYPDNKKSLDKYFYFKDTLKKDDIVAVMPILENQTWVILSRVVSAGDVNG
jgi:hypothetical protein